MDEGNEIGDFRVFIGVGKLWVLPKIGCIAWRPMACRQAPAQWWRYCVFCDAKVAKLGFCGWLP